MRVVDQNSALRSQQLALAPSPTLVDGRTEQDWLSFLTEFATVINFYDRDNKIHGNWSSYLLKDQVFLLAAISKTNFNKYHVLYVSTCNSLAGVVNNDQAETDMAAYFNNLFDQLIAIFMKIKGWVYFMHRSGDEYELKNYVTHQARVNFSRYFWAVISLQQNLYLVSRIKGLKPVDWSKFYFFDAYDEKLWKKSKDKTPYWDVLGLQYAIKNNSNNDFLKALTKIGDELFSFFYIIITKAAAGFEKLRTGKSPYPDTVLLRAFVNLLQVHQGQLNGVAQKHLDFYYNEILLQTRRQAQADSTVVFAELAKPDSTFNLPAGTLFSAGIDAKKNPVLFANSQSANLNPASIADVYTLATLGAEDGSYSLSLQNIASPGVLEKDANGNARQWDTFGGDKPTPVNNGMAFASPMLLLNEGQRNIQFNFGCTEPDNLVLLLNNATYYLSTEKEWFKLKKEWLCITVSNTTASSLTGGILITVNLDPSQPAITAFAKNSDGLDSNWPMLKIELAPLYGIASPPVLTSLTISVTVSQLKTFRLYNSNGALSTKTPYQLFGPVPLVNSGFIIGSSEIFSKPLTLLCIEMHWDNLPADFTAYYQQYNNYIEPKPVVTDDQAQRATGNKTLPLQEPTNKASNFFKRVITWPIDIIGKIIKAIVNGIKNIFRWVFGSDTDSKVPFNNVCFNVDFQLLHSAEWQQVNVTKTQAVNCTDPAKITADTYIQDSKCTPGADTGKILLFSTEDKVDAGGKALNCHLTDSSFFTYKPSGGMCNIDATIQNTPLKFSDGSTSGFIRMVLTDPQYGFGSQVYPGVVANVAMQNAIKIKKEKTDFIKPANVPFAPKLNNFLAHYTASQYYDLTASKKEDYPIQCFLYTPFNTHKTYDSEQPITAYQYNIGLASSAAGLPLFLPFNYNGYLYIGMNNLIPSESLSMYVGLNRKYGITCPEKQIDNYYLSTTGWKQLLLTADGTNNFTCSGIIEVNVPGDIEMGGAAMPGNNNYWFALAVKNDAHLIAQTTFLKTNAFKVIRSGSSFLNDSIPSQIALGTISKPQSTIPQIAKIIQPFASDGGTVAESQTTINQRISNRIKTKDRAVSAEDYFRLIKQEFPDVYFSKVVFNQPKNGSTCVFIAKACQNATDINAFVPLVGECTENKIKFFLNDRTSAFSNISISNFNLQYLLIQATIMVKPGFASYTVQKKVNDALNIFLAPWINSPYPQISIDQGVNNFQVIKLVKSVDGVSQVSDIAFKTWLMAENYNDAQIKRLPFTPAADVLSPSALLVPYTVHDIICTPAA